MISSTELFKYVFMQLETEFEEQWTNGKVEGWENVTQENGHVVDQHAVIDLDYYSTVDELVEVGPEKLKEVIFSCCASYSFVK